MSSRAPRLVAAFAVASLAFFWTAQAGFAQPLDAADLSTRPILVEVPGFAAQLSATYGAGTTSQGEVQISAEEYERYLDEVGDSPGGVPVPGSFSDVVLSLDLSTFAVTAAPILGQVDIMIGPLADLVRTLGTDRIAGQQTVQVAPGSFVTIFCDGPTVFGPCQIMPGSAFDPATGEFEMVGDDTLTHPDITDPRFARYFASNTFRLLEAPSPVPTLGFWLRLSLAGALLGVLFAADGTLRLQGWHDH